MIKIKKKTVTNRFPLYVVDRLERISKTTGISKTRIVEHGTTREIKRLEKIFKNN